MAKSKPPKYCSDTSKNKAFIRIDGKKNYLPGKFDSPESREAYARFELEWWGNARRPAEERVPVLSPPGPNLAPAGTNSLTDTTVSEVALKFLQCVEATKTKANFTHYRLATMDFLVKHYGSIPVDEFTPACLNLIREAMIQSRRYCRNGINDYTRRIGSVFTWGVSTGMVSPITAWGLSTVKPLEPGHPGTFDHPEREYVQDDVIITTLPLLPPTLQAMVKLQRLTAMRPNEVFKMRVGDIDRTSVPGIWLYRLATHKTQKKTRRKRIIPLNVAEQALIAPYLEGKTDKDAVFSPRTAQAERYAEKRANRKSKLTPSQKARDKERAAKPRHFSEFYNKDSYRQAVEYAIKKANKRLPKEEQIPYWTPYELRHSAASAIDVELKGDAAQLMCGHTSPTTTATYLHREVEKLMKIALEREAHNPFEPYAGSGTARNLEVFP